MLRNFEQRLIVIIKEMGSRKWIKSHLSLRCLMDSGVISEHLIVLIDRGLVEFIPNIRMPNKRHNKSIRGFYTLTVRGRRLGTSYIQR